MSNDKELMKIIEELSSEIQDLCSCYASTHHASFEKAINLSNKATDIVNGIKRLECEDCGGEYKYEGRRAVCENGCNHPDGSFSYMCDSQYCRCSQ